KLTEKDIERHKYNKIKTLFTLNGYLLPANKNVVLPIGADAHEMYRVKNVIWYNYKIKKGVCCRKNFIKLFMSIIETIYTCIIVIFRYKKAQKSYKKDFNRLCRKS
ncbi:MAG: hypothetical protein UHW86_11855, partial [Spirochaetota bacterium]|nr:hypothetical protein [Spirochaetota bacterium]